MHKGRGRREPSKNRYLCIPLNTHLNCTWKMMKPSSLNHSYISPCSLSLPQYDPPASPISHTSELLTSGRMLKELQRFNFDEIRALRSSLIIQTIEATCKCAFWVVAVNPWGQTGREWPWVLQQTHPGWLTTLMESHTHTHPQLIGLHVCMMLYWSHSASCPLSYK